MSECSLLTPLRRDGTSQRQRLPRALDPASMPIDERPTSDLLLYAGDLGRLLRYYSEANVAAGDWSAFIEHDISTLAARVGAFDPQPLKEAFDRQRDAASAADEASFGGAFTALLQPVFDLAQVIERWRHGAIAGLSLRTRLDRLIEGVFSDALLDAVRAGRRAAAISSATVTTPAGFGEVWGDLSPPPDAALFASGSFTDADERDLAIRSVERSFERLYEGVRRLKAEAPQFFAETLADYPQHRPHVALFLAFLRVFNQARQAMNALTASHLDFYYRDVLRLVPRGPVADRVHVIFELAKNLPRALVEDDTRLNAGKDATGVPRIYATDGELVVNRAALDPAHGLKNVFIDLSPAGAIRNIHAAPDADAEALASLTADGQARWTTFGSTALPFARVGFALASPMLWLSEGTRKITVRLELAPTSDVLAGRAKAVVERELSHNVTIEVTGAKGWVPAAARATVSGAGSNRFIQYAIELDASAPALTGFDPAVHLEAFDTTLPVLRVVLRNDGLPGGEMTDAGAPPITDYSDDVPEYHPHEFVRFDNAVYRPTGEITAAGFSPGAHPDLWQRIPYAYPYRYFAGVRISRVRISVEVAGMRAVLLENDAGRLNAAKPFTPFGSIPRVASSFLIGSWEIFQKRLSRVSVRAYWSGTPAAGFASHYSGYVAAGTTVANNLHFTAALEVLHGGTWTLARKPTQALFNPTTGKVGAFQDFELTFDPTAAPAGEFTRDAGAPPVRRFEPGLTRGFMRLKLNTTFLHELFPIALAAYARPGSTATTPPNPPYTPTISELTVGYSAEELIDYTTWTRAQVEGRVERLFHIAPFGHQEFAPVLPSAAIAGVEPAGAPVPIFTVKDDDPASGVAEGTLLIGLAHLAPPQNVSLLFQLAEGSEDPALPAQDVQWGYLTASGWKDFARSEILADSTNELIASGIVQFAVPKSATAEATLLPRGLHWLRATVARHSGAIPKLVAVHTQAAAASFRDAGNDPAHLAVPLAAQTIAKLIDREAGIKSVSQPYSSFGGRMAESDAAFRVRVAERLRHKRRAVTVFDYERLVLDRFPEVYKVRCLTHTDAGSEFAPGSVRLVVVPDLRNRNAVDPLRPRLALARLEEIRRDVQAMASDFADIAVVNPDYEEVRVRLNVRFRRGFDKGFYTGRLEQDIIRFLSPWLYDEGVDLHFGGRVHRSAILNFIDERAYVDFVTDFEMDHVIPATASAAAVVRVNVEEAEPSRSSAVIVPAASHTIGDDIVSCGDEPESGGIAPAPSAPRLSPGAPRYLGNVRTRELHDLQNVTAACQIDEIGVDRKYPFRRIEDAQAIGYDFCAYCFAGRSSR